MSSSFRSWASVADVLVKRMIDYRVQRGRDTSRVRFSIKALKKVRGVPDILPITDADWRELQIELAVRGFIFLHASTAHIAIIEATQPTSWTLLGIESEDDEE